MAKSTDKRLSDLEDDTGGGQDEINCYVNWRTDGLIEDDDGTPITEAEWRKRHPHDRLIVVRWPDGDE